MSENVPLACPHCGVTLDPPPQRSRKCPECREQLVVRTDRATSRKLALTPEEAQRYDAERKAAAARKKARTRLEWLGVTPAQFDAREKQLAADWGRAPGPGDVYWSLANEQVTALMAAQAWQELKQLYWQMALHLNKEGRDHRKLQLQSHQMELKHIASKIDTSSRAIKAVEIGADACCEVCSRLNGTKLSLSEASEQMLLPVSECTRPGGWCNCSYLFSDEGIDAIQVLEQPAPPPPATTTKEDASVLQRLKSFVFGAGSG